MSLSYQQSTQWYQSAVDQLTRIAAAMQRQEHFDLKRLSSLASEMVESLNRGDQLVVEALAGSSGSPLITNLINVGILATKVGVGLGYSGMELERLALAGLVHDIGLFAFPQSLVTKAGHLTPEERMLIERISRARAMAPVRVLTSSFAKTFFKCHLAVDSAMRERSLIS